MSEAKNDAMAAVIGLKSEGVQDVLNQENLSARIANYNSYTQVAIMDPQNEVTTAQTLSEDEPFLQAHCQTLSLQRDNLQFSARLCLTVASLARLQEETPHFLHPEELAYLT